MGSSGRRSGGGGRGRGGRAGVSSGSVNFDPLACYRCGVRGHLARDCPNQHSHREVAMLALPVEDSRNLGKKAHGVDEAVEGKSDSVP